MKFLSAVFFFLFVFLFSVSCSPSSGSNTDAAEENGVQNAASSENSTPGLTVNPNSSRVYSHYFDIAADATPGSFVVGTLQMKDNRKITDGTGRISDLNDYAFVMTNPGNGDYELITVRDQGKLYAELKLVAAKPTGTSTDLLIELRQSGTAIEAIPLTVHVVNKTQWKTYFERVIEFAKGESRMWGRKNYRYGSMELEALLQDVEANNGKFMRAGVNTTDYGYVYNGPAALRADEQSKNGKAFIEIASDIGAFGYALADLDQNDSAYNQKKARLVDAIISAFNSFVDVFPLAEFDGNDKLTYNDITHQWRFYDPVGLPLLLAFEDMYARYRNGDEAAARCLQNIYRFYQISFGLTKEYRGETNDLYTRYFFEKDLSQSPGAFADANRHHRIRSWAVMAGLFRDYNLPLTDRHWWYEEHTPFLETYASDAGIFEQWEPKGAFYDLKVWVDTNTNVAQTFRQSGLLPDGTVSHHTGVRQDLAMLAYGYEWVAETPIHVAALLNGLEFEAAPEPFSKAALFMVKSVKPIIYQGGTDFQAVGRSFLSPSLGTFGKKTAVKDIDAILAGKPPGKTLAFENELADWRTALKNDTYQLSGNFAYWNTDFMVHRRGGNGEVPWYASFRGQSVRSRGAESYNGEPGFHNGSGILQVKVEGDEYDLSRMDWDWHLLPGLTEEWRTDDIPMQAEDDAHGLSRENLVGVLSDGRDGLAAMRYSTESSYASAKADKFAFFSDFGVYATGDNIVRDPKTNEANGAFVSDPNNHAPIVTTVDQALWKTDIHYDAGNGEQVISRSSQGFDLTFDISAPVWFHQGRKGYILWPQSSGTARIQFLGGNTIADTYQKESSANFTSDGQPRQVFALLFNHGMEPDAAGDSYRYVIIPNVSAAEMPEKLNQFTVSSQFEKIAEHGIHGVVWKQGGASLIQLAFFQAGAVELLDGKKIRVDKPALVQFSQKSGNTDWTITVSDPTAFVEGGIEPVVNGNFASPLKDGDNRIQVDINWGMNTGNYTYQSQRIEERYFDGQNIAVSYLNEDNFTIRIDVDLPDKTNAESYGFREELYSGMSASFTTM